MPAENEFEKSIRQKLDSFEVVPQPADWQAVYEELHPSGKRRLIWWIVPLMLGLVLSGVWLVNKKQVAGKLPIAQTMERKTEAGSDKNNVADAATKHKEPTSSIGIGKANADLEQGTKESNGELNAGDAHAKPNSLKSVAVKERKRKETLSVAATSTYATELQSTDELFELHTGVAVTNAMGDHKPIEAAGFNANRVMHPSVAISTKNALTDTPFTSTSKTKMQPSWKRGFYAGAGLNMATEPMSSGKSFADFSSGGVTTGGFSRVSNNVTTQSGWHFAAGVLTEKRWNKNWLLQAGAGFNYSTWASVTDTYVDSVMTTSGLYNTAMISKTNSNYSFWMAELPVQIANRIGGSQHSSFWWTAGINNQFALSLKEESQRISYLSSVPGAGGTKNITGSATLYQPQFRLGFMHDHVGNMHWQLVPMMNYSLTHVFNNSNNAKLLNLQLQFRMYLQQRK
jgi:hypothetical protein